MRIRVSRVVAVMILLGISCVANAQIFRVQGGTSTLFGADGGSLQVRAPGYEAQIGLGVLDGQPRYGFLVRTTTLGKTMSVGDDTVKVDLPTDVFDSSHYFLARGVGLERVLPDKRGRWYAFVGTTSLGYSTPFFMAAQPDTGLGILYLDRPLSGNLRFVSRTLLSRRQTSIQSLEWTAGPDLRLSASAGVGSNQPYFAGSMRLDRENLVLRASYIAEGERFQRMQVPSPISSELEKENIAAVYRVNRRITVRGSHENIIQPEIAGMPLLRAKVDEGYATLNVARFDLGAGLIRSASTSGDNVGLNFYATRAITRLICANANIYQSRPENGAASTTIATTVREQISQRLALTQTIVRSNGQTTSGLGGEIIGNRFSAFVGYQTVYVPFRPDKAFQQALSFNAHVNLPGNMRLTAGSFLDPQGKMRYTVGIGTYLYRLRGMAGAAMSSESFRFPKYVVKGVVVDPSGSPIEGAAIHVDGKVTYSDSAGNFMIRLAKSGPHSLQVAMDEFIAPGSWEVVEAPNSVLAQSEQNASPIQIVLRRARPAPVK